MLERFLALCQFDISFGGFGILPEFFSTEQLKAVFFWACDISVPRDGIKHLWGVNCARPIFQCPTNRHKKSNAHSVNCCSYPHFTLGTAPLTCASRKGMGYMHVLRKLPVWHIDCLWLASFHLNGQMGVRKATEPFIDLRKSCPS